TVARATYVLIGLNAVAFLAQVGAGGGGLAGLEGSGLIADGALCANAVGQGGECGNLLVEGGQWWRIITAGFLHGGLLHLGLNMLVLYILGTLLEPAIGTRRF